VSGDLDAGGGWFAAVTTVLCNQSIINKLDWPLGIWETGDGFNLF
jgi:hypothetical protein